MRKRLQLNNKHNDPTILKLSDSVPFPPKLGPVSMLKNEMQSEIKLHSNGPELFTFANHEPKGGCVLLNDGTVKFIRTEDELHALRWK